MPRRPWRWAVRDVLSAYLPVLLMALLALATWWLVKNTPLPGEAPAPEPPRHEADYSMRNFTVQRFSKDGPLRVQIDGAVLRHFPDTDTLEIEDVRIRAIGPNGRLTLASARRALANGDATEVQLVGGAQVTRETTGGEPAIKMTSEFLHAFLDRERVRSHLPVVVRRGATEIRADAFEYDHLARVIDFKGRIRATIAPRAAPRSGPPPANG
jgi:lipopolysaccharide export system protein LptC